MATFRQIFILFFLSTTVFAQKQSVSPPLLLPGEQMFFDAKSSQFTKDGSKQIFSGNTVAILGHIILAADELILDNQNKTLQAKGRVVMLIATQAYTGESLFFKLSTGDFELEQGILVANHEKTVQEIVQKILGFTEEELAFEVERQHRMEEIQKEKNDLREGYQSYFQDAEIRESIIDKYALLLNRQDLVTKQPNPMFARMSSDQKSSLESRRKFWNESRAIQSAVPERISSRGYFYLQGSEITKSNNNDLLAKEAFVSPCQCEDDETPAWGFTASEIKAQEEGYMNLKNSFLNIKGIPILYFPYMKLPLKNERQTGFLFPSLSHTQENGSQYSQSLFIDMNPNQDATITTDIIEKRGVRLGVEHRYQGKQYSGWQGHIEGVRDPLWFKTKKQREDIIQYYELGLAAARQKYASGKPTQTNIGVPLQIDDPNWWANNGYGACLASDASAKSCIDHEITEGLRAGGETWRGKGDWSGQYFLTPRVSFLSEGSVVTDHQYLQDLYIPDFDQLVALYTPNLFSRVRLQNHHDQRNYYFGLSSSFADQTLAQGRFEGYQLPIVARWQSKLIQLTPTHFSVPIYAQTLLEHKKISQVSEDRFLNSPPQDTSIQDLSGGEWSRAMLRFVTPISTNHIISVDQFTELEARRIEYEKKLWVNNLPDTYSQKNFGVTGSHLASIQTLRTGLNFNLPLDGKWELPGSWMADSGKDGSAKKSQEDTFFLEHRMNWQVTFSLRPSVVRRGTYGDDSHWMLYSAQTQQVSPHSLGQPLTYFESDYKNFINNKNIPETKMMIPHEKVIFTTKHDWLTFGHRWKIFPGTAREQGAQGSSDTKTFKDQARQDLLYSLDRPILGSQDLYDQGVWYASRYQLETFDEKTPMHFDSTISYDYFKEKTRKQFGVLEKQGINKDLLVSLEPWSPLISNLNLNWQSWTFNMNQIYNLYEKTATKWSLGVGPPAFFSTNVGVGYSVDRDLSYNPQGQLLTQETHTTTYNLSSKIIPNIETTFMYARRSRFFETLINDYSSLASVAYLSPSNCWGLKFIWKRDYQDIAPSLYLSLVVKFFNYDREFGNLTSRLNES